MSLIDMFRLCFGVVCLFSAAFGLYYEEWMRSCAWSLFYVAFEFSGTTEE